jgi:hypothetical protein
MARTSRPKPRIKISGYAKLLIFRKEGGVEYPLIVTGKAVAKRSRACRASKNKEIAERMYKTY